MLYINNITNDPSQLMTLTGIPGLQITLTLRYMPRIQQWIMGVSTGTFSVQGIAVVGSLNLLRQWKNIIPFGISVLCSEGIDPYQLSDFQTQFANLYLLNSADVAQIESDWFS